MLKVSALIVEDNKRSRIIIKEAINQYNCSPAGNTVCLEVIGEAQSYEEAAIAISVNPNLKLIFLDINLKGTKSGLEIFKDFGGISYIIISKNVNAWREIFSESKTRPHDFIVKVSEGNFNIALFLSAINKFIREKGSDLDESFIQFPKNKILKKDIAFISKKPLSIDTEGRQIEIQQCRICEYANASFFYSLNVIHPAKANHKCLLNEEKRTSLLAMDNIIEKQDFDTKKFIRINGSTIINLDYICHRSDGFLYANIKGLSDGNAARIEYSKNYIPATDKELNALIDSAISTNRQK